MKRFLALNNNDFPNGSGLERSDVWQRYKISKRAKRSQYTTGDNHVSHFLFCCVLLGVGPRGHSAPIDHNSDSLSSGSRIMRRLHVLGLDQLVRYPLALAPDWYRVAWAQHQKNIRGLPTWQGALQKVKP